MNNILKFIASIVESNWKLKILAFWLLSALPGKLLFYFQHNITKRSSKQISQIDKDWIFILKKLKDSFKSDEINLIEFGAGRNLAQNIFLSLNLKNLKQTVIDVSPMMNPNMTFQAYIEICNHLNIMPLNNLKNINDLLSFLRISYLAPADISSFIPEKKYDICVSKDTIEHIPKKSLDKIFFNLRNILVSDGILISCVDYTDHYSHTNSNLSNLNFLRYNTFQWFFLNPPNHYQNRIRHSELLRMLEKANFSLSQNEIESQETIDIEISKHFSLFETEDLLILRSRILSINKGHL